MFSVVSVCSRGGSNVTNIHYVLDLTIQDPLALVIPPPVQELPNSSPTPRYVQNCLTWTSLNRAPWTWSNVFNFDLSVQGAPLTPHPSDVFIIKHVRLTSERLASYWNAFLLKIYFFQNNLQKPIIKLSSGLDAILEKILQGVGIKATLYYLWGREIDNSFYLPDLHLLFTTP